MVVGLASWSWASGCSAAASCGSRTEGRAGGRDRGLGSMYLFGVSYATVSLSCTLGPFLVVLTPTFRSSGTVAGMAAFVWYALGMGLVVGAVTVAVAGAQGGVRGAAAEGRAASEPGLGSVAGDRGRCTSSWYGWWENRGDFACRPRGGPGAGGA